MSVKVLTMEADVKAAFNRNEKAIRDLAKEIKNLPCGEHDTEIALLKQREANGVKQKEINIKLEANKWSKANTVTAIGVAVIVIITFLDKVF